MDTSSGKCQRKLDFSPRRKKKHLFPLLKWDYAEYTVGGNETLHYFLCVAPLRWECVNGDALILEGFNALL